MNQITALLLGLLSSGLFLLGFVRAAAAADPLKLVPAANSGHAVGTAPFCVAPTSF